MNNILNFEKWNKLFEDDNDRLKKADNVIGGISYKLPKIKNIDALNKFTAMPEGGIIDKGISSIFGGSAYKFPIKSGNILEAGLGDRVVGSLSDLLKVHAITGKQEPYKLELLDDLVSQLLKKNPKDTNLKRLEGIVEFFQKDENKESAKKYMAYYSDLLKKRLEA